MGLKLNGTTQSQLKVLASIGIAVSKKNIAAAVLRIEQFCFQKAMQKIQDATVGDLIDRNKNSSYLEKIKSIYLNRECSEISFNFLLDQKESLKALLSEFEEIKMNKKKVFEIFLSEAFLEICKEKPFNSNLWIFINKISEDVIDAVYTKDDLKSLLREPLYNIKKFFYKMGHLLSEDYFSTNATTTILRTQAKIALKENLFTEEEMNSLLNEYLGKLFVVLDASYSSFRGVHRLGSSGYGYFCPDKEKYKYLFDSVKEEITRIFQNKFNEKFFKKD